MAGKKQRRSDNPIEEGTEEGTVRAAKVIIESLTRKLPDSNPPEMPQKLTGLPKGPEVRINLANLGVRRLNPRPGKPYSDKRLQNAHDKVRQGYLRSRALKNKGEADKLHQFFSGYRVPQGMTKVEVRICLYLHEICRNIWEVNGIRSTHAIWNPCKRMTRKDFQKGFLRAMKALAETRIHRVDVSTARKFYQVGLGPKVR